MILRRLSRDWGGLVGATGLLIVTLLATAAPLLPLKNPYTQDIGRRLLPPAWMGGGSSMHPLGTDPLGRDLLSRIVFGSRASLVVGITAVGIAGTLGVIMGMAAGFYGGVVDVLIMRLADIQLSFPFILLVIAFIAILGPGLRNVILVLGIVGW